MGKRARLTVAKDLSSTLGNLEHGFTSPSLLVRRGNRCCLFPDPGHACGGGDDADSPEHRAALVRALDARIKALHAQYPSLPGIVVHLLEAPARLSWGGSVRLADRANGLAMPPNATFRTASITNTFTAAAIFRLTGLGKVATADPIERHLSAATLATLIAGGYDTAAMTLDHLLTHRSGLPDHALSQPFFQAVLADPTHRWTRAEQLDVAMALGAPTFAPGSGYQYSDTGYLLLGEIVERRTGQTLGAAYRSLLNLGALGLAATYQESIDPVPAAAGPRAKQELIPGVDDSMIDASTDLFGAGGLVSDARDLSLFMRGLLEGKVLGPNALRSMLAVASTLSGPPVNTAYARGLERFDANGTRCWGHSGFSGAFAVHCPNVGITLAGSIATTAPAALDIAIELVEAVESVR